MNPFSLNKITSGDLHNTTEKKNLREGGGGERERKGKRKRETEGLKQKTKNLSNEVHLNLGTYESHARYS